MHRRCTWSALITFAFIALHCSGAEKRSEQGACTPGQSVTCACVDGTTAVQTCNAESTFDPCNCDGVTNAGGAPTGTGGSVPSGGSSGISGNGGALVTGGTSGSGGASGGTGGIIGSGSAAGAGGTIDACPAPPAGAPDTAIAAWTLLNQTRLAAGAGCMNLVATLDASAQAHCDYVVANNGNDACLPNLAIEVEGCTGYTGTSPAWRQIAAGYPTALAYTADATTYSNDPSSSVPSWIDSVFHRLPLLDPWTTDMGHGGAIACDVVDIGHGVSSVPTDTVVVYPYDGQIDVPPANPGIFEGPIPPAPPSGWPSSYPVTIYAQGMSITEHVLTRDGDATPLEHLWLDAASPEIDAALKPYFTNAAVLYGAPFELTTTYRVKIVGTYAGGALSVEWSFTTGSTRPFGT